LSSTPTGQGESEAFLRHYEDLRGEVLTGETSRTGSSGLALVVHRGLVAWMRVTTQRLLPASRRDAHPPSRGDEEELCEFQQTSTLGSLQSQLTLVLANMILGGQREATA